MYEILPYSYDRAKELNVIIQPSKEKNYKIDIFDSNGKFITSGGDKDYLDYPHYIEEKGLSYADERRRLYKIRHKKNTLREHLISYILW
jgi:hypothetical protein